MSDSPTPDVSLREKAERATPGPWTPTICGSIYHPSDILARAYGGTAQRREANAAFIAACSPDVILAQLSRVERAEADSKRLRTLGGALLERLSEHLGVVEVEKRFVAHTDEGDLGVWHDLDNHALRLFHEDYASCFDYLATPEAPNAL